MSVTCPTLCLMEPLFYRCDQEDCPHGGEPRPVYPVRAGHGMVIHPNSPHCDCSPGIEMRLVPAPVRIQTTLGELFADEFVQPHQWVYDEGHVTEPCS